MPKHKGTLGNTPKHRYHTRSKGPVPKASAGDHNSVQQVVPSSSTLAATTSSAVVGTQAQGTHPTTISSEALTNSCDPDPPKAHSDEADVERSTPRLFTLPNEIQAKVYELAVVKPWPIELTAWPVKRDSKSTLWRIGATVHPSFGDPEPGGSPSVLAACKHLRIFVTPIFFSLNTFSVRAMEKVHLFRQMWGEDVRHIRSIMSTVEADFRKTHQGQEVLEKEIPIWSNMNFLPDGTLVIKHEGCSYHFGTYPHRAELCQCQLQVVAAHSSAPRKDSRRMFEVLALCVWHNRKTFKVVTCHTCKKPRLVEAKKL